MSDYISRADAIKAVASITMSIHLSDVICDKLLALPSADAVSREDYHNLLMASNDIDRALREYQAKEETDAVDCTDFIEWLVDRVLDETIWENNSVAYGEIICRKLEKLGILEVTEEPSYYIRPSADAVQGEWIRHGEPPWYVRECSKCGTKWHQWSGDSNPNYCGHCGARMKGGDDKCRQKTEK